MDQSPNLTCSKFRFQSSKFTTLNHEHKMIDHLDYECRLFLHRGIEAHRFRTIAVSCELTEPNISSHSH